MTWASVQRSCSTSSTAAARSVRQPVGNCPARVAHLHDHAWILGEVPVIGCIPMVSPHPGACVVLVLTGRSRDATAALGVTSWTVRVRRSTTSTLPADPFDHVGDDGGFREKG
jgi:hypothetical protein